jgi:hypothetical protein
MFSVARMGEIKKSHGTLFQKPEGKRHLAYLEATIRNILLKWVINALG